MPPHTFLWPTSIAGSFPLTRILWNPTREPVTRWVCFTTSDSFIPQVPNRCVFQLGTNPWNKSKIKKIVGDRARRLKLSAQRTNQNERPVSPKYRQLVAPTARTVHCLVLLDLKYVSELAACVWRNRRGNLLLLVGGALLGVPARLVLIVANVPFVGNKLVLRPTRKESAMHTMS